MHPTLSLSLPQDLDRALLIGRVWRPAPINGPSVVVVRGGQVFDITRFAPTTADLFERGDAVDVVRTAPGDGPGGGRVGAVRFMGVAPKP